MRGRGRAKARRLVPFIPSDARTLLDLGGAEGYVGEALRDEKGVFVTVADIVAASRTDLPFVFLTGGALPFADDAFDVSVLCYVLHHAAGPQRLLEEAVRVTRQRVLILESVYTSPFDHATLRVLDRLANRLRSRGASAAHEQHLLHRSFDAWRAVLSRYGALHEARTFGRWPHHQALFALDLPAPHP